jgi:hypothetical protein
MEYYDCWISIAEFDCFLWSCGNLVPGMSTVEFDFLFFIRSKMDFKNNFLTPSDWKVLCKLSNIVSFNNSSHLKGMFHEIPQELMG